MTTVDEDDTPADGQTGHNLRPNQTRSYNHRLGHIMDNPANSNSYDTQFFQQGTTTLGAKDLQFLRQKTTDENSLQEASLREAVQEMQRTGANHDVL